MPQTQICDNNKARVGMWRVPFLNSEYIATWSHVLGIQWWSFQVRESDLHADLEPWCISFCKIIPLSDSCRRILSGYGGMEQDLKIVLPPSLLEIAKDEHSNHKGGEGNGVAHCIYDVQTVKHLLGERKREKFQYWRLHQDLSTKNWCQASVFYPY